MIFTISLLLLMLVGGSTLPDNTEDLVFYPPVLEVTRDSTGFIQHMIVFGSATGDSVVITRVEGSCRCATGSVQRSVAYDTTQGKIYLSINAKHFVDSLNYVDYTIQHTGPHSPQMFRVVVRLAPQP